MSPQRTEVAPVTLFYSYAPADEMFRDRLEKHLSLLRRQGVLSTWSNRQILAGTDWSLAIDTHLDSAEIILLLISPDFLDSNYCFGIEMQRALEKHQHKEAIVIPIILRPVDWQGAPFAHLQGLPRNLKPVTSWPNEDEVFKQIAEEIRRLVKVLRQHIFIIASPNDQVFKERLSQDLAARGLIVYSENEEKPQNIYSNEEVDALAIRTALSVLFLVSSKSQYSHRVREQIKLANLASRPVITLCVNGDDGNQSLLKGRNKIDIFFERDDRYEEVLSSMLTFVREQRSHLLSLSFGSDISDFPLTEPHNPYKGLEAFTENDARYFFGRDRLIDELASTLEKIVTLQKKGQSVPRLLTILGSSGSGKSSAVMAGLLPCLSSGGVLDSNDWLYLDRMLPGKSPLEALAVTLAHRLPERGAALLLKDLMSDSIRSLHLIIMQMARGKRTYVVLFIDQFEELFTLTTSENERQYFIDLLITAVTEPYGSLLVILALRGDFYHRTMNYPALSRIMQEHMVQVFLMEVTDLRNAIEQPASLPEVRVLFEDNLVSDLLFEAKGQEGFLPLIQFTLEKLFQQRHGRILTRKAYDDMGGVKGALAKHAEDVYRHLPSEEHRASSKDLFLRLIKLSPVEQDTTRRRALLTEFLRGDVRQAQVLRETMEKFIAARLLTASGSHDNGTVEVSHEALIDEWPRLSEWLHEARDDILLQQKLSDDVADWDRRHKPTDQLYRGSELKQAQELTKRRELSEKEKEFLQVSVSREQKKHIQQRILFGTGSILSVLLAISLIVALLQQINLANTQQKLLVSLPVSVTTLADHGPGSLRSALQEARLGSVITFAKNVKGNILLTTGELRIAKKVKISGPGTSSLSLSGGNKNRIFFVENNAEVVLSNIAIINGYTKDKGGAIFNNGLLNLINCTVSGSVSEGYGGGGIYNDRGHLTLINTVISDNKGPLGAGVANYSGTLTIANSTIIHNIPNFRVSTTAIMKNSYSKELETNSTYITSDGFDTLLENQTSHAHIPLSAATSMNGGLGYAGGGIYNAGILTLMNSTVVQNEANNGGGLVNFEGIAIIITSTFSENKANASHTFGAGIYNLATLMLSNSTITGNKGQGDGSGVATTGPTDITFCTIYNNTAAEFGGGLYITEDTIYKKYPQVIIRNSIIAGNHASSSPDISGSLTSYGHNLIENIKGASVKVDNQAIPEPASDLIGLSPDLGSLQDNGGPTLTLALQPGSPAIHQIPFVDCFVEGINTDQRGVARPDPEIDIPDPDSADPVKCDIGAYQTNDYKPINNSS